MKNVFKTKAVYAAMLAGLGAVGAAGSANATQLGQDGTGQVLIYPYYTTRTAGAGDYNTLLNVVNTTNDMKVVKVRFIEGKNSREVLDFNLYLSPYDVWAAAITPDTSGAGLSISASSDNSCVTSAGGLFASKASGVSFDFVNFAYVGASTDVGVTTGVDGADTSRDRTREGYIEIIEMGVVTNAITDFSDPGYPTYTGASPKGHQVATGVTHDATGVPADCGDIAGATALDFDAPEGGLMGGASIINVNNGSDFGYDAVPLEDFANPVLGSIWSAPGNITPDLRSGMSTSNVFYYHIASIGGAVTDVLINNWSFNGAQQGSVDAVSAVLMRSAVMNTYILDEATNSSTDWVVTFPTKRHYISADDPDNGAQDPNGVIALQPFTDGDTTNQDNFFWNGLCNDVSVRSFDREEQTSVSIVETSPPTPGSSPDQLCWEANVISIVNDASSTNSADYLLGSKNHVAIEVPYEHGWAYMQFADGAGVNVLPAARNTQGTNFFGLPVVGFMVQDFLNPNVSIGGVPSASSYGGNFNHRYQRNITDGAGTANVTE